MTGILAVLEGIGFFVVIPVLVGVIIISLYFIYQQLKTKIAGDIKESVDNLICAIDSDCPPGFICINGKCVPQYN